MQSRQVEIRVTLPDSPAAGYAVVDIPESEAALLTAGQIFERYLRPCYERAVTAIAAAPVHTVDPLTRTVVTPSTHGLGGVSG